MKKRLVALMAVCGILASCFMVGCGADSAETSGADSAEVSSGSEETADGDQRVFYFVAPMSGDAVYGPIQEGFEAACAEMGIDGRWVAPAENVNTAQMVELCENALTQGADAILVNVQDDEPYSDVMTRAIERGIPVIVVDSVLSDDYMTAQCGTEAVALGKTQANVLYDLMKDEEEINVVFLQSQLTNVTQNQQYESMMAELEALGANVNLVFHEECKTNSSTAQDKLTALKKANPSINAVVVQDGYGTEGTGAFIKDLGLEDEVYTVGSDSTQNTMQHVKDGSLTCTIIQHFYQMAYESVEIANDYLDGKEIERVYDTGTTVLYKDDIEEYAESQGITLD